MADLGPILNNLGTLKNENIAGEGIADGLKALADLLVKRQFRAEDRKFAREQEELRAKNERELQRQRSIADQEAAEDDRQEAERIRQDNIERERAASVAAQRALGGTIDTENEELQMSVRGTVDKDLPLKFIEKQFTESGLNSRLFQSLKSARDTSTLKMQSDIEQKGLDRQQKLQSSKITADAKVKAAEVKAATTKKANLGQEMNIGAKILYGVNNASDLTDPIQTERVQSFVEAKEKKRIQDEFKAKSFAESEQSLSLPPDQETDVVFVDPVTLKSLPVNTTKRELIEKGALKRSRKAVESVNQLNFGTSLLADITVFMDKAIDSKSAESAAISGGLKTIQSLLVPGSDVGLFDRIRSGFSGVLSRLVGGEVGVLTDRDRAYMLAALPTVFDSVDSANTKIALFRTLFDSAREQAISTFKGDILSVDFLTLKQNMIDKIKEQLGATVVNSIDEEISKKEKLKRFEELKALRGRS